MPFKTKRQKIAAQQKRYVFSNGKVSFGGASPSAAADSIKLERVSSMYPGDETDLNQNKTLKPEIIKIALISFFIIGLQMSLRLVPSNAWLSVFH